MTRGLWIVIGLCVAGTLVMGVFAHTLGGGFTAGVFPPETRSVRLRLVPIESSRPAAHGAAAAAPARAGLAVPDARAAVEPMAPRWEIGADGRARLLSSD